MARPLTPPPPIVDELFFAASLTPTAVLYVYIFIHLSPTPSIQINILPVLKHLKLLYMMADFFKSPESAIYSFPLTNQGLQHLPVKIDKY